MAEFPELPGVHELAGEDDERREHRFTRLVAVAIVLTTLAAAATAFLQASAGRDYDEASDRATDLASSALAARTRADQASRLLVRRHGLASEQRTRAAQDAQRATFSPTGGAAALAADRRRWLEVAALTDRDTRSIARAYGRRPIEPGAATSPDRDRFFPQRFLAQGRRAAYELAARRDGANDEAEQAAAQVGRYAISLTVFAVAVFLFGYALTPHARRRRALYAGAGLAFALGGLAWATATATQVPEAPEREAARAFAAGRVAFDSERYGDAVRALDASLEAWPEYGAAHALRARAEFAAGSPQLDIPLSLTTEPALAASVRDQQRALELGTEDSRLVSEHGFQLIALGLRRGDDALIERGLRFSEEAAEDRPTDPVPVFNAALAELALGREDARERYREAVERTVFADERHRVRRDDVNAYEFYLGEALTDLQMLAGARPALREDVAATKAAIVAPVTRASYGESLEPRRERPEAEAGGLRLSADPAHTGLTILEPRRIGDFADLSAQWYFRAPGGLGWSVLPDVSGAVNGELVETDAGSLEGRGSFLSATGSCLSPGRYRLELYVNGRAVAEAERDLRFPALHAARLRELGLAFCRPRRWRPLPGRAPGLLDGAQARGGEAGTLVVSVPREVAGATRASRALSRRVADAALRRFAGRLPQGLRPAPAPGVPFMEARGRIVRAYRYPGGRAFLGAGAVRRGAQLVVAVTWGPSRFMAGPGRAVFASLDTEGG